MRILIFFMMFSVFSSCKPQAPVTPREAFFELKNSFLNKDYDRVVLLLTDESISRIKKTSAAFSLMDETSLKSAAAAYGLNPERLKKLSVKDYLAVYNGSGNQNVLNAALGSKIIGIDKKGSEAVLSLDNGMKLKFVKSGPYWKFDMTEF